MSPSTSMNASVGGVNFSDRQSSTAVTSTSLNGNNKPEKSTTGSSAILTSNASLSTSGVAFSDRQSSTAVTSTSLNGTTTTSMKVGTSANTFSTTVRSATFISTSVVTSSTKQSSTALTSTSLNGENGQSKHLIIIVAVVVTVLLIAAISVAVIMLHRRRCKKPAAGENAYNDELPNEIINLDFMSNKQSPLNFQTVETSNYDQINDKYIATYSIPGRKENDSANEKNDKTHGEAGTIDAYNRIEFAKKCAVKMPNYDSVSALEVKKVDDTYSHISYQSQPASAPTTNDYSHCQYVSEDSQSNVYPNKVTLTNEARVADNYSHVDLDSDKTKRRQSNIVEDDPYNHINIDNTINAYRNREAVSVRTIYKSDDGYPTLKEDLQSLDVDRDSGVSSQDSPPQDIKAVSLPDNYIECKVGDIYDTPRCKAKQ